ncbi:MAG: type II toxin-antitoxin system HicA family toxin [Chloroflexi bacterium]|nr:type II toxin-antitoxin system HicA family toxin [Chloroflexota bacterium]MBP8054730.1 type II toxin-antitoxin system HicA family toxin [Chloroflexota bacterium]
MPAFSPIKRRDLILNLRKAGFDGPYSGSNHQYMTKGHLRLSIPNPHKGDIGTALLSKILRQAGISRDEWENL